MTMISQFAARKPRANEFTAHAAGLVSYHRTLAAARKAVRNAPSWASADTIWIERPPNQGGGDINESTVKVDHEHRHHSPF